MQKDRGDLEKFYSINDSFGCFIEYNIIGARGFVSLVEFDFIDKIFRKIRTVELNNCWDRHIFVDEFDPLRFTLILKTIDILHIQSFKLLNGSVNLENTAQYANNGFPIDHYFDRYVYGCSVVKGTWNNVG
jgi:hypothetical protein